MDNRIQFRKPRISEYSTIGMPIGISEMPKKDIPLSTYGGRSMISFGKILPPELDIFSELPEEVYHNDHARQFLASLRNQILLFDREEISNANLSKLYVSQYDADSVVIEWIFNYFRLFFGFDNKEGDYYGQIMTDTVRNRFSNDMSKMEPKDFDLVAEAELFYAVMMSQGDTSIGNSGI